MDAKKSFDTLSLFVKKCINTCISLAKIMIRLPAVSSLPVAEAASCAILGNGPSLNLSLDKHPSFFKDRPLLCVNGFSLAKEYSELKPSYYVMLDSSFWLHSSDIVLEIIGNIKTKTTWKLCLLLPPQAKRSPYLSDLEKQNPNIRIVFFNYTVFKGFDRIGHFFYRRNMAMIQSQNVLAASLFLSVNMGFKDIYLFGADHTWHENLYINEENVLCVKHKHFYENEEKLSYMPFYKARHLAQTFRMDEIFHIFSKTFYGYVALNNYAISQNCRIYNASEVSFIDAFKRIKL
jgi:hypothetical protein